MAEHELIYIGTIGKAHGIRGEVRLHVGRLHAETVPSLRRVLLAGDDAPESEFRVETIRPHQDVFLVKFEEVADRNEAESLRGLEARVRREEIESAGADTLFPEDLVGLDVITVDGDRVGELEEILEYPASDMYRVRGEKGEHLIPAVPEIVVEIDPKGRRIVIAPPEGLLDLNHEPPT